MNKALNYLSNSKKEKINLKWNNLKFLINASYNKTIQKSVKIKQNVLMVIELAYKSKVYPI